MNRELSLASGEPKDGLARGYRSLSGVIVLRRATNDDFDWMTSLRNKDSVRKWFLDSRKIEPSAGRSWLAARASRDDDTLLIIAHAVTGCRVGTLGWICPDGEVGAFETGRLAIDAAAIRTLRKAGVTRDALGRIALDAHSS